MRITDVRCVEYTGSLAHPNDIYPEKAAAGPVQPPVRDDGGLEVRAIFLHIDTDEQITGSTAVLSAEQAHTVLTVLRPQLLGADPLATERIWDLAYRSMIHGRAGTGMLALSAVDCALWDIRGRHFGVPAHVLLGGPTRDDVPE